MYIFKDSWCILYCFILMYIILKIVSEEFSHTVLHKRKAVSVPRPLPPLKQTPQQSKQPGIHVCVVMFMSYSHHFQL